MSFFKSRRDRSEVPLLVQARDDPEAFVAAYDAYAPDLLAFCARRLLCPELAFDVQAETFAIALERLEQFRGTSREAELGWLYAIARSLMSRHWRSSRVSRENQSRLFSDYRVALSDDDFDRVEALADLGRQLPALERAMDGLPVDQREAVRQRVVDELSYSEIARGLNVSEQVVRARVSRGLRALAGMLAAQETPEAGEAAA